MIEKAKDVLQFLHLDIFGVGAGAIFTLTIIACLTKIIKSNDE